MLPTPCGLPQLCFQVDYTVYKLRLQGFIGKIIIFYKSANCTTLVAVTAYFAEKQKWAGNTFVSHSFLLTHTNVPPLVSYCIPLSDSTCDFGAKMLKYLKKHATNKGAFSEKSNTAILTCGVGPRLDPATKKSETAKRTGQLLAALSVELVIFAESALAAGNFYHEPYSEDETVAEAFIADQFVQVLVDADEIQ